MSERELIRPQPRNGRPFQLACEGQRPTVWYNERLGKCPNPLLFSWTAPSKRHRPKLIDGKWYWVDHGYIELDKPS